MAVKLIEPQLFELEQRVRRSEEVRRGKEVEKKELSFEVKLPSRGRHGYSAIVRCRPLKVKDVKALIVTEIADEMSYVRRLVEVVGDTIIEPEGFDVKEMTWNDFVKVLIAHRVNSLGSVVDLNFDCVHCGHKNVGRQLNLITDLKEKELDESYGEDPFEVEGRKFRFPRLSMFWSVTGEVSDIDLVRDAYLGDDFEELEYSVFLRALEHISRYNDYGVDRFVMMKCDKCGGEVSVEVPFFLFLGR